MISMCNLSFYNGVEMFQNQIFSAISKSEHGTSFMRSLCDTKSKSPLNRQI